MTIVVGFAPRHGDRHPLEFAATLARSADTDLLAVCVVPAGWPTATAAGTDREFQEYARYTGEHAVNEAEEILAEHCPDLRTQVRWVSGRNVPSTLLQVALDQDASMLVVGSGHSAPYGHLNLTTAANQLLHSSPIPVGIAVRGYLASDYARVTRATCAFRGDEVSRRTLQTTAEICQEVGSALRVATFAIRGRDMYPSQLRTGSEEAVLESWIQEVETAQREAVEVLRERDIAPDEIETVVARGRSWVTALDSLEWQRDEVLVIGSSSAGLMTRLFLGSSGTKILRHSPVSAIVVP